MSKIWHVKKWIFSTPGHTVRRRGLNPRLQLSGRANHYTTAPWYQVYKYKQYGCIYSNLHPQMWNKYKLGGKSFLAIIWKNYQIFLWIQGNFDESFAIVDSFLMKSTYKCHFFNHFIRCHHPGQGPPRCWLQCFLPPALHLGVHTKVMHRTIVTLLDDDYTFRLPLGIAQVSFVVWRQRYKHNPRFHTWSHTPHQGSPQKTKRW